ncbi:citrate synthase [Aspergillus ambiguus]|uniref:putative citrate synthase n=1 Tax=Aspergillus ambiguus TaxID=176160 RepID=UPI003CCC9240
MLHIRDSRTNKKYKIPINDNAVLAADFQKIKITASETGSVNQASVGIRVHDPGLQNTTVVKTDISFFDHDHGSLLLRGYTLEQLEGSDFEDILHLLVWGSYPTTDQREALRRELARQMMAIPESVHRTIQSFPATTYPLPLLIAGLSAYLACVPETIPASVDANMYQGKEINVDHAIIRTIAAYAVVLGSVSSHRRRIKFTAPSLDKSYCENVLTMAGLVNQPGTPLHATPLSCFRRFTLLSSEHGMALSVFSALVTASSLPDPISSLISSVAAAYGPLHFGATETAHRTLQEIGSPDNVPAFIAEVKEGRRKLFGYGHRSYKGVDPRVRLIQSILDDLDLSLNPIFKIAERIKETASEDDYFLSRGLFPNADFYGHFVFSWIGLEPEMMPAAMLSQRIIGIMAHWREYMLNRGKLFRPSHIYSGRKNKTESCAKLTPLLESAPAKVTYSAFTTGQKRYIILAASIASTFSPLSANIYYPALNSIAADLHVSISKVNLTITTYMICQGLAPTLMGSFADQAGRRPAYFLCFLIYISGNIALALQHSYPALLILRGLQSCGSSGTVALASAVAADVATSAERGSYMGITSLGNIVAPSLGPILGGVLSEYFGWRAIFWFLAFSSALLLPNPLATLRLLLELPTGLILLCNGIVFASYYSVMAAIPFQLKFIYFLSDLQIGLCFISAGIGSLTSATFNGIIMDWNYRRVKEKAGQSNAKTLPQDHELFSVEKARLDIGLPMMILAMVLVFSYGLTVHMRPPLYVILLLVFAISFCITAVYNVLNVLLVDLYYGTPATVMAANNLVRCFLGSGTTALVHPLIQRWGNKWTYAALIAPSIVSLRIRYPENQWINPGDSIQKSYTQKLPIISTDGLNENLTYLLLFYDVDVIYGKTATVALHWYQPNMVAQRDERSITSYQTKNYHNYHEDYALVNLTSGAEYIAPRPPPGSHHRYVYLLFHQKDDYMFPECFSHIFPPTSAARAGFDIHQFVQASRLDAPFAGNYFYVDVDGPSSPIAVPTTTSLRSAPCQSPPSTFARAMACENGGKMQVVISQKHGRLY